MSKVTMMLTIVGALICASTSCAERPTSNSAMQDKEPLVEIFKPTERKTEGAYFWDDLRRELPAWRELQYEWIATSRYGDQIIVTRNSPIHSGTAVYMHGPDVGGPKSNNSAWIDNILYLGPSIDEWTTRVARFGDEHSVEPANIRLSPERAEEYRAIYRRLNPGLSW